jgi:hypothetical protein
VGRDEGIFGAQRSGGPGGGVGGRGRTQLGTEGQERRDESVELAWQDHEECDNSFFFKTKTATEWVI